MKVRHAQHDRRGRGVRAGRGHRGGDRADEASRRTRKPDDIDLQFELGSVYERAGDPRRAEKVFLRSSRRHPDHAADAQLPRLHVGRERRRTSIAPPEMLTRAVEQEPNNGAYIDSLGWVYFRQGKLDLAEKYLHRCDASAAARRHGARAPRRRPRQARRLRRARCELYRDGARRSIRSEGRGEAALQDRGDRAAGTPFCATVVSRRWRCSCRAQPRGRRRAARADYDDGGGRDDAVAHAARVVPRDAEPHACARDDKREIAVVPRTARRA